MFSFPLTIDPALTLHRGLYEALRAAILDGRLRANARLPSTRVLADEVSTARGTVVEVYAQLQAEGYVVSRHGSGTRVAPELPDKWFAPAVDARRAADARRVVPLEVRAPETPFGVHARNNPRPFRAHTPAVDEFPLEVWSGLVARRARRDENVFLGDSDAGGYRPLRQALAEHLRVARGVVCDWEHLVIASGAQQILDLVARLVLAPGDVVAFEDPGYVGARALLSSHGARLVPIPVDSAGLVVEKLSRATRAKLVYTTPAHQEPLGVTMSVERRLALLDWAAKRGAVVLEDDYDGEYRYADRPVPVLQGLDRAGLVVHAGTFSKTMLPSLRLAYAVLPDAILEPFLALKSLLDRFTAPLLQAALTDFIADGHFERHLRRMRPLYAERRQALVTALAGIGTITGASAGIDLSVRFDPVNGRRVDDIALADQLGADGIEAMALSRSAIATPISGLSLGFASFSPARIARAAIPIRRAYERLR